MGFLIFEKVLILIRATEDNMLVIHIAFQPSFYVCYCIVNAFIMLLLHYITILPMHIVGLQAMLSARYVRSYPQEGARDVGLCITLH